MLTTCCTHGHQTFFLLKGVACKSRYRLHVDQVPDTWEDYNKRLILKDVVCTSRCLYLIISVNTYVYHILGKLHWIKISPTQLHVPLYFGGINFHQYSKGRDILYAVISRGQKISVIKASPMRVGGEIVFLLMKFLCIRYYLPIFHYPADNLAY